MAVPRILVMASGTRSGGGTGFGCLLRDTCASLLRADICAVSSQYLQGFVNDLAFGWGIWFVPYLEDGNPAEAYQYILSRHRPDYTVLCGFTRKLVGADPERTFNIHPGPLPLFGGLGMVGRKVHEQVLASACSHTEVCIHRVTEEYDEGEVLARYPVPVLPGDTSETLQARVKEEEHRVYGRVLNHIFYGTPMPAPLPI